MRPHVRPRRPLQRGMLALLATAGWIVAPSCAGSEAAGSEAGRIEITVDLLAGTHWTAQGELVAADSMCAGGTRYLQWRLDPVTGWTVNSFELAELQADAGSPTQPLDIVFVYEYVCGDGRGSFVTAEHPPTDGWTIVFGRGAFATLAGDGTRSLVHDLNARPSEVFVVADVDLGAADWTGVFDPSQIDV